MKLRCIFELINKLNYLLKYLKSKIVEALIMLYSKEKYPIKLLEVVWYFPLYLRFLSVKYVVNI